MTFHRADMPTAGQEPNRCAVVIATDIQTARHLSRLVELSGLASRIEHHASVSAAIVGGATGIAVMDISLTMVDAAAQVARLRQGGITTIVVILPTTLAAMVPGLIEAGADTVLDGSGCADDLRVAIRAARTGHCIIAKSLALTLGAAEAAADTSSVIAQLTPRQRQIARALITGAPAKVIAHDLGLAGGTVKIHASAIYRRVGVRNRTALANLLGGTAASVHARSSRRADMDAGLVPSPALGSAS